jgi:uncharacterized protein
LEILVTGASGLLGSALEPELMRRGHHVTRLVRHSSGQNEVVWNPESGTLDLTVLPRLDAVIHLAGENIGSGRWNPQRKERIMRSRVEGTKLVARALANRPVPPQVLISASAVGFYGDRGNEVLTEDSGPGTGFLAEVCRAWESESLDAGLRQTRCVRLRIGMVLAASGGALAKMLPPFRLGLGGTLGNGRQFMSWITIDDLRQVICFVLEHTELSGAVNAVAPNPATNREFTRALCHVLRRPSLFPVPAFAIRLLFGQMGDELLLASTRVIPVRLSDAGFKFRHVDIDAALRGVLEV